LSLAEALSTVQAARPIIAPQAAPIGAPIPPKNAPIPDPMPAPVVIQIQEDSAAVLTIAGIVKPGATGEYLPGFLHKS
jgi:hypothetical protein